MNTPDQSFIPLGMLIISGSEIAAVKGLPGTSLLTHGPTVLAFEQAVSAEEALSMSLR